MRYDTHGTRSLETLIDFGRQPLTNRFLRNQHETEETFPLALGIDPATGLVQLLQPAAVDAVRSRFDWIKYNEAEDHLDDLTDRISRLPGIGPHSRILALSYKDDTLIERLRRKGFIHASRLDLRGDLEIDELNAGLETIQQALSPRWAREYVTRHGHVDVVIARHIWEHCHQPADFIVAAKTLATPEGYVVLEVPDCSTLLESHDYSMPWEEHVLYFTPFTFAQTLTATGLSVVEHLVYPYPLENSLVAIARAQSPASSPALAVPGDVTTELARARQYAAAFSGQLEALRALLTGHRKSCGEIALLGAGHSACMFINLHQLGDLLAFIVDDAPVKQGLFMPGSRLPIKTSGELLSRNISLCILSVNHNAEDRVVARNAAFEAAGGEFRSLYRTSPRRLPL
jgi:hypothetical protein